MRLRLNVPLYAFGRVSSSREAVSRGTCLPRQPTPKAQEASDFFTLAAGPLRRRSWRVATDGCAARCALCWTCSARAVAAHRAFEPGGVLWRLSQVFFFKYDSFSSAKVVARSWSQLCRTRKGEQPRGFREDSWLRLSPQECQEIRKALFEAGNWTAEVHP